MKRIQYNLTGILYYYEELMNELGLNEEKENVNVQYNYAYNQLNIKKESFSFYEHFKNLMYQYLNNNSKCQALKEDPHEWYQCIQETGENLISSILENSNAQIPENQPKIDKNNPVYQVCMESLERFMSEINNGYMDNFFEKTKNPAISSSIINLYIKLIKFT